MIPFTMKILQGLDARSPMRICVAVVVVLMVWALVACGMVKV